MEGLSSHTLWKLRMMKRASMGSKDESYEHVLMCLICRSLFDDYDHQPKFLPCHHTFCKDCLKEYCRQIGDEIECPSCRKIANIPAAGVAALQTNFYVKYIQSLVSGGGGQSSHSLECSKHTTEKLQFYCKECERSICKECLGESDLPCQTHDKVAITKITEESHQKLDASFSGANATIEGKKVKLEKALKALAEEKDSALLKIDSTFEQHAHTLTRRATLLKNKVIDIYNEHVEKLEADLMEISTALTCIVSLKDYHEDKISHGDYKEFAKGIEDMEEVDKNIADRIHPVETHILFEGGHGSEKYRACAKDLGRVKFNRIATMPRTEPEGNDSTGGAAQASGSVPQSPIESPKHECPDTPSTPTPTEDFSFGKDPESPVRTPDSLGEPAERCLPGSGFCDSGPSSPAHFAATGKPHEGSDVAAAETTNPDNMKSSMTTSQTSKLTQSKICDATPKSSSSNSSNNNNNSPNLDNAKGSKVAFVKSQITPPKQKAVMTTSGSTIKAETVKDSNKSPSQAPPVNKSPPQSPPVNKSPSQSPTVSKSPSQSPPVNKSPSQPLPVQSKPQQPAAVSPDRVVPGCVSPNTPGVAFVSTNSGGGKSRPRNLLMPAQRPNPSTPQGKGTTAVGASKPSPSAHQGTSTKPTSTRSPKEGIAVASGGPPQVSKPSRLPGLSGLCRIPKPRGMPAKVQMDARKGVGVLGFARRSPTGQRLSPSAQSGQGNLGNNGNPNAPNKIMVPSRNGNGNVTMQPIPEGIVNANDSDRAKAEKEYYHLLYTSYDEEELLKELKSGKANLDDSDSWMTISSGDESNSTNCSDEVLVEPDQTTF